MERNSIFISYSHKDRKWFDEFQIHLRRLARQNELDIWDDTKIPTGANWKNEIEKGLQSARVAVCLVSKNFLDSNFVTEVELPKLLDAANKEGLQFCWVLLGHCLHETSGLQDIQAAHDISRPIRSLDVNKRDATWVKIVHKIAELARGGIHPEVEQFPLPEDRQPHVAARPVDKKAIEVDQTPNVAQPVAISGVLTVEHKKPGLTEPGRRKPPLKIALASGVEMEFMHIPAGEFLMGSDPAKDKEAYPDEQPQHKVYLSEFYMGKYPVMNEQYNAFVKGKGKKKLSGHFTMPEGKEKHPAVNVTWSDAQAFCEWLAQESGKLCRLPSEAEWEKAARGDKGLIYPWGNAWDKQKCNMRETGIGDTTPVGQFSPAGDSPYGCVDMVGNVWEWCADWFAEDTYSRRSGRVERDPHGPETGVARVLRGGSFSYDRGYCRCACRGRSRPRLWGGSLGFRVVVVASPISGL